MLHDLHFALKIESNVPNDMRSQGVTVRYIMNPPGLGSVFYWMIRNLSDRNR